MSKSKALIGKAIADDLGIKLSSITTDLKTIASEPDTCDGLIFAFVKDDMVYYDTLPLWRTINGMRIKIPKFQSHLIIEERLSQQVYNCYFSFNSETLTIIKLKKINELKSRLPMTVKEHLTYTTNLVTPVESMGLRKKALLFNRNDVGYEPFT